MIIMFNNYIIRYIMSQHPELFDHNRIEAEPPITAFQPRYAYNRDNVTLELLENLGEIYHLNMINHMM